MIRFDHFSKSYGGQAVISAHTHLPLGIYWLKGGNGTGKTTLLRSIAGLMPFGGAISIDDVSMKQRMAYRLKVNYAEAEPVYPAFVTGAELIQFHEQARHAGVAATTQLVEAFGAGGYTKDPIGTYSSGMLKKLSLILAFIGAPKLILLDEPLITLDAASVQLLQELIQERYRQQTGFLITSHQELVLSGTPVQKLVIDAGNLQLAS